MKLKTLLLITLLAGLIAYAAVKGVLYYQVRSQMDRLAALAAPFARLDYDAIESSLQGGVAVTGVTLMPAGAPAGIRVERVELRGDGPGFLLELFGGLDPRHPPERLQLAVSRMSVPLGSDYLQTWGLESGSPAPDLCSLAGLLGQTEIERLGFRQRLADARLRYDLDRPGGQVTLGMEFVLDGLAAMNLELVLGNLSGPGATAPPSLERLSLHYRLDPDYMRRAVAYCAGQAGLQPAAYVDGLFSRGEGYFANSLGFVPGVELRTALRRLVERPGELLITALPEAGLDPARLSQYAPSELVERLGIRVSVNDRPVTDLSFSLPPGGAAFATLLGEAAPADATATDPAAPDTPAQRPRARYIDTPVPQLRRHLGRDVRIFGAGRSEAQQGILMALGDQQLELEQRLYGGKMTLYIPLAKIRRVEVLRWE